MREASGSGRPSGKCQCVKCLVAGSKERSERTLLGAEHLKQECLEVFQGSKEVCAAAGGIGRGDRSAVLPGYEGRTEAVRWDRVLEVRSRLLAGRYHVSGRVLADVLINVPEVFVSTAPNAYLTED